MPTVLDATVINSAYDTSGNGGRKITHLSNGWIVTITKTTDYFYFQVNKQDGNGFVPLCHIYNSIIDVNDASLVSKGTDVHVVFGLNTTEFYHKRIDAINQSNVAIAISECTRIEPTNQNALGNVSLAINEAGTELHAAWASKNSTYPNSFNIRYAKGTINADGSVAWGAVVQQTVQNATGTDNKNPTIVIKGDGYPSIIWDFNNASGGAIYRINMTGSGWGSPAYVYNGGSYAQSSPSAIFVPQSVNGLANGRIWVAWVGKDSTDTTTDNLRFSYSDDGGVTWSTMTKLTSGNTLNQFVPSMTFDKNGEVFIVWEAQLVASGYRNIRKIKNTGGVWSSIVNVTNSESAHSKNPSTLLSSDFDVSEPLFIYQGASKVGFYGTWTVTTISVTPGDIGQKTDKANLLTYSITTDGTMSAITEKVNGVTVGTKTATSGEVLIAGLTQEQWDAVRFGRYADATGGKNTLTIEMGSEKWTYTFDKRPATDADIISAAKAHKDIAEVVDPARRALVASAIRSKGGSALDTDAWETMAQAVEAIDYKMEKTGTATAGSTSISFINGYGTNVARPYVTVTGLGFKPDFIEVTWSGSDTCHTVYNNDFSTNYRVSVVDSRTAQTPSCYVFRETGNLTVTSDGFTLPVQSYNQPCTWKARKK